MTNAFGSIRRAFGSLRRPSSSSSSSSRASVTSTFSTATTATAASSNTAVSSSASASASSPNTTGSIQLTGTGEFEEITFDAAKEMLVMASLKAPLFEQNPEEKRAPIDVCCVLDRSGSMQGEKLELVKKAMLFVLDNLDPADSLAVVLYDTQVDTLFNFTKMDKAGKATAKRAIEKVVTADCTNLCGGLIRGLELQKGRRDPADISSVLLFTDGLANEGIVETQQIVEQMQRTLDKSKKRTSVFTFGFGRDHNEGMLRAIAEAGAGMYYFVEDVDKIPVSFADCLGGLQSVVAQNLILQLEGAKDVRIVKSLNAKYKITKGALPSGFVSVELGDLYSEEERDVIFAVELPKLKSAAAEDQVCLSFSLTYFNVLQVKDDGATANVMVRRPEEESKDQKPNEVLDKQRNRLRVAEAMEQSRALADKGDMEAAREVLKKQKEVIQVSASSNDDYCMKLTKELDDCVVDMASVDHYQTKGSKVISRKEQAHYYQRSNRVEDSEEAFYETSSKMVSKKKAKGLF